MNEAKRYTKKQLLEMGFSVLAIKGLTPVEFVKAMKDGKPSRGRPAGLYSDEQVEALKAGKVETVASVGTVVAAGEVETVTGEAEVAEVTTEPQIEVKPAGDLTEADFAQAA